MAVYTNGTTYFNHADWLGSVRAWSNVSGASVGTCTGLPYGDSQGCSGTVPNSWAYTGLPYDSETGLTHALFRQLSTAQGHWTTTDPSGMAAVDPTNPQSWDRYAYVENTPVNANDPLGLHCPVYVNPPPPGCGGWGDGSDVWTDSGWNNYWEGNSWGGGGGGGGFSVGFSGDLCNDFTPCGMPMPGLLQSIWSDLLGLPTGLNCPQVGGISNLLCGGISPVTDAANNGQPVPCQDQACELARAIQNTGVQTLNNPCTLGLIVAVPARRRRCHNGGANGRGDCP